MPMVAVVSVAAAACASFAPYAGERSGRRAGRAGAVSVGGARVVRGVIPGGGSNIVVGDGGGAAGSGGHAGLRGMPANTWSIRPFAAARALAARRRASVGRPRAAAASA